MHDTTAESVSRWLARLKAGDQQAPEALWERYFLRLVELARNHLRSLPRRVAADEEDVALSTLHTFFDGVKRARFPQLHDREDLWKLLLIITARKARALRRRLLAGKRDELRVVELADQDGSEAFNWLEQVFSPEPCAENAAILAEELQRRLDALPDDFFRQIATAKLEGYTNREIADKLGTYEVKIERKLRTIRSLWRDKSPDGISGDSVS